MTETEREEGGKQNKRDLLAIWRSMPGKERKLIVVLAAALCLGIVLLRGPAKLTAAKVQSSETSVSAAASSADQLRTELESILSQVKGAGKVSVAIYYSEGPEQIYAVETEQQSSQSSKTDGSVSSDNQLLETLALANDQPVAVKQYSAQVGGVVVVADGAGDAMVRERIYVAIKSLLGLSAAQIAVIEGEAGE